MSELKEVWTGPADAVSSDQYEITVQFTRSRDDDEGVVGSLEPGALVKQFVRELQAAYDADNIAGHFRVVRVRL